MKKKTWKTIAITAIGTTVASVVVIFKLAEELEYAKGAHVATNDMLKEMVDDGILDHIVIGEELYTADN